jgi:hypothetical protein
MVKVQLEHGASETFGEIKHVNRNGTYTIYFVDDGSTEFDVNECCLVGFNGQLGSVTEMASADSVDKIIDALRANSLI